MMAAAAAAGVDPALSALLGLPSDVWRVHVLPLLANEDALRLSVTCTTLLLPVAAAGLRCLQLRAPQGGNAELLAGLLLRAPHAAREVCFSAPGAFAMLPEVIDDFAIAIAVNCPNLTSLNVSFCHILTDVAILAIAVNCPNLTEFDVSYCRNLTDVSILAIAEHCSNLTDLDVSLCDNLTDVSIQAIAEHCSNLTNLHVGGCDKLTDVSIQALEERLPNLSVRRA